MVTLKMLKPYYIKNEKNFVRIILAYQYFSVIIKNKVYQFIPVESNEIRVNRRTEKIENIDAVFAFQNGKEIVNVPMVKLITLPEFLEQIHDIARPYYFSAQKQVETETREDYTAVITELERQNVLRLIDKALDERDEDTFKALATILVDMEQEQQ
ncbi:IDEAL domain-containing protein [Oceanobacillus alkalisoli]|uniref:IDEAL domain-containing protein n=1 Tax=Oceanobacillus alkalisoli TaxID=2925113 RepID=UPI001EEFB73E|nr:IDEAL domain-containing protein [Oceanobacillus alkalisoli]MCF3943419.1 IDEAL domain-containing protein [Oceanobacillus alkalisoli]MCG5104008.1 IDEAL domain-containing protein [Oceanobacillus alkalisoli]